jgi:hypothetical protein
MLAAVVAHLHPLLGQQAALAALAVAARAAIKVPPGLLGLLIPAAVAGAAQTVGQPLRRVEPAVPALSFCPYQP